MSATRASRKTQTTERTLGEVCYLAYWGRMTHAPYADLAPDTRAAWEKAATAAVQTWATRQQMPREGQ